MKAMGDKICPICKGRPRSDLLLRCDTCGVPFVRFSEGLGLLSKDDISSLASAILRDWRIRILQWVVIPVSILSGVALAAFFLQWSAGKALRVTVRQLQERSSNDVALAY